VHLLIGTVIPRFDANVALAAASALRAASFNQGRDEGSAARTEECSSRTIGAEVQYPLASR